MICTKILFLFFILSVTHAQSMEVTVHGLEGKDQSVSISEDLLRISAVLQTGFNDCQISNPLTLHNIPIKIIEGSFKCAQSYQENEYYNLENNLKTIFWNLDDLITATNCNHHLDLPKRMQTFFIHTIIEKVHSDPIRYSLLQNLHPDLYSCVKQCAIHSLKNFMISSKKEKIPVAPAMLTARIPLFGTLTRNSETLDTIIYNSEHFTSHSVEKDALNKISNLFEGNKYTVGTHNDTYIIAYQEKEEIDCNPYRCLLYNSQTSQYIFFEGPIGIITAVTLSDEFIAICSNTHSTETYKNILTLWEIPDICLNNNMLKKIELDRFIEFELTSINFSQDGQWLVGGTRPFAKTNPNSEIIQWYLWDLSLMRLIGKYISLAVFWQDSFDSKVLLQFKFDRNHIISNNPKMIYSIFNDNENLLLQRLDTSEKYEEVLLASYLYKQSFKNPKQIWMNDQIHPLFTECNKDFQDFLFTIFPNLQKVSEFEPILENIGPAKPAKLKNPKKDSIEIGIEKSVGKKTEYYFCIPIVFAAIVFFLTYFVHNQFYFP